MNTAVETRQDIGSVVDDVIAKGDLSKLTAEQRVVHYHNVCKSIGLNPLTQPLQYITLNSKLVLYARKDACDQLRKLNGINIEIANYAVSEGLLTVHVRAVDKTGRRDEDYGVVSVAGLKGEPAANAFLKAVTKAKRRVTLSISGLGFLDESEVDDLPSPQYGTIRETPQLKVPENRQAPEPPPADATRHAPDQQTEQLTPHEVARSGDDAAAWSSWATTLMAFIRAAPDAEMINEWTTANFDHLAELQKFDGAKSKKLIDMINHQIGLRTEPQ